MQPIAELGPHRVGDLRNQRAEHRGHPVEVSLASDPPCIVEPAVEPGEELGPVRLHRRHALRAAWFDVHAAHATGGLPPCRLDCLVALPATCACRRAPNGLGALRRRVTFDTRIRISNGMRMRMSWSHLLKDLTRVGAQPEVDIGVG